MKPILFVRNDPVETFGVGPAAMEAAGVPVDVWHALDDRPAPSLDAVSGVVLFGGTCNVDDLDGHPFLRDVRAFTRAAIDGGTPVLGICLGAQLIARVLDRPVPRAPEPEVGFEPIRPTAAAADDPLLAHYADGDPVFHWHQDTFELPEGAVLLATGDRVANQAYRIGDRVWGIQFHLELDAAEYRMWIDHFHRIGGDLLRDWGKPADRVEDEVARWMVDAEARGREVFRRFADVAGRVHARAGVA
ncbi:MAG: type 1 glutamine amidotransferase [Actinomycetota bacterium]